MREVGINISVQSSYPPRILSGADLSNIILKDQLYAQLMLSPNAFTYVQAIKYIFFGLHLVLLGYLVLENQ